jgi:photosystem II stability/assembly factor-like uncharacterized protein
LFFIGGVTTSGRIYKSSDGGTWLLESSGSSTQINAAADAAGILILVTEGGDVIWRTGPGAFSQRYTGSTPLKAIHAEGTSVLAVGDSGVVLRSIDSGSSWTELTAVRNQGVLVDLRSITTVGNYWVAAGVVKQVSTPPGYNLLFVSPDMGTTWYQPSYFSRLFLNSLSVPRIQVCGAYDRLIVICEDRNASLGNSSVGMYVSGLQAQDFVTAT